ncbi:MAG: penicillin-binding protein 2 [Thermodesulfobacteriota bacterium]
MEEYCKTIDIDWFRHRLAALSLAVAAVFVVLFARLFFLQVIEGDEYRRLSENNCIRIQKIEPPRGLIYDRGGICIVDNRPSFDLSIMPREAGNVDRVIETLVSLTGLPSDRLYSNFAKYRTTPYRPVLLAQDVGRDVLAVVEAHSLELPGVIMDVNPRRNYPHENFAAHLVGYLGEVSKGELESGPYQTYEPGSIVGKCGVERVYDAFLRGRYGGRQVEVNASGNVVRTLKTVEAESGHDLHLTIDFKVQEKAESLLAERSGAAVALDPYTGEVLALVSRPAFPQNRFVEGLSKDEWLALISDPRKPMENKAVQSEYPPASVYKIVTTIAGLQEGVIDANSSFFCPGYYRFGDRAFRCWEEKGHGHISTADALARSCDVFYYQVGLKVGVERLAWYAKGCGLGRPTGIDLFPEDRGLVPSGQWKRRRFGAPWYSGETLSVAIGQSYNLVTPIQLAVLAAAIANGGVLKRPVVLKRIETVEGELLRQGEPRDMGTIPISEKNMAIVREGMWRVVNSGYGTASYSGRSRKVEISGKTGTAQVVAMPQGAAAKSRVADTLKDHAWFVAYAPSKDPKIAVAVLVEHGEHGSSAAAPVARAMIEAYLGLDEEKTGM